MNTERQFALRKDIRPDPNQPRKIFDPTKLAELAESIKKNGIQEDLIVRPDPNKKAQFMIIEGERRWRAAELAGIERLPVQVREISEEEVRKIQHIVGTMRENLNALEEGQSLVCELEVRRAKNPAFTLEELADEMGVKRTTAYNRVALLKLAAPIRKAFAAGEIDASKALLIAGVPAQFHDACLKAMNDRGYNGEPMSYRRLQEHIKRTYRVSLKNAPFDPEQSYGLKLGGVPVLSCKTCPKRSGIALLGQEDAGDPNVCTDPSCYRAKTQAAIEGKPDGKMKVMNEKQAERAHYSSDFVEVDSSCYEDGASRKWKQILGEKAPAIHVAVVQTHEGTKAVEYYERKEAEKIAREHKLFKARAARKQTAAEVRADKERDRERAKREEREKRLLEARNQLILHVQPMPTKDGKVQAPSLQFWKKLAKTVAIGADYNLEPEVLTGRGHREVPEEKLLELVLAHIDKENWEGGLIGLIVHMLLCGLNTFGEDGAELGHVLQVWGIDWKGKAKPEKNAKKKPAAKVKAKAKR